MPNKVIAGRDKGEILEFSPASLYASCGPTQLITAALMFRLFERAFIDLSPETPEAVSEVLYFEVQIKERPRGYWPPGEGFFSSREALPKALPY
jgi:hypothetical protein